MSKTIDIQIEKSRNLIAGLRRHVSEMGERGISNDEIAEMEKYLGFLAESSAEVDRLRDELSLKVKRMNEILSTVKTSYTESKKMLKGYYSQEQWAGYGIPDKR